VLFTPFTTALLSLGEIVLAVWAASVFVDQALRLGGGHFDESPLDSFVAGRRVDGRGRAFDRLGERAFWNPWL
jgi:hypothetical protein